MAEITVQHEQEHPGHWLFDVRINRAPAETTTVRLRLDWTDYDLWSRGSVPPARVAEQAVRYALEIKPPFPLRASFDAGMLRRWRPQTDEELPARL